MSIASNAFRAPHALRALYGVGLRAAFGRRGLPWRVNGETFRIDPRVRRFVPHESETTLFAFLREHIRPGDVVFDIGSFLGVYAMLAARSAGAGGRVLAFEPSAWSFDILQRHVRMNGLAGRIDARLAAVGACRQRRALVTFSDEPYRNMIGAPAIDLAAGATAVDVITLDDVCDAIGRPPDWIRMDVQGLEFDVLRGAARMLHASPVGKRRVRIVAEMHPSRWPDYGVAPADAPKLLADLGLRARSLNGHDDPFRVETHAELEPA
jgi:FkbM family methyltransferase